MSGNRGGRRLRGSLILAEWQHLHLTGDEGAALSKCGNSIVNALMFLVRIA